MKRLFVIFALLSVLIAGCAVDEENPSAPANTIEEPTTQEPITTINESVSDDLVDTSLEEDLDTINLDDW